MPVFASEGSTRDTPMGKRPAKFQPGALKEDCVIKCRI